MMWGLFIPQFPEDHVQALNSMSRGLSKRGIKHFCTGLRYEPCDIAVVFGTGKKAVPASWPRGEIIKCHRSLNKNVMIIEKGFVKRDKYFHIGWNGLNGRANFLNKGMKPDRWPLLNTSLVSWQEPRKGGVVIVCGQVPWDASVQHSDHLDWCSETIAILRATTSRKIIFRPHPVIEGKVDYGVAGVELSKRALENDLARAHAVVTFNSNSAVDAVIRGIPVFTADKGSMALGVSNTDLSDIENPLTFPRQKWANNLAYSQWTLGEMSEGLPIAHLTRRISEDGKTESRVS